MVWYLFKYRDDFTCRGEYYY